MVDKVKPLKLENPALGGTQNDMIPTELNPASDYVAALGVALSNLDTILLTNDGTNMTFKDLVQTTALTLTQLYDPVTEVSSSANATTSSSTDALLTGMTITPGAGNYLLFFMSTATSDTAGAAISFSVYLNGVQQAATLGKISPFDGGALSATTARGTIASLKKITLAAAQAATIQWSISSGTGTCGPRVMCLMKVP